MVLRNRWYDWRQEACYRSPVPVVSVGNLSTGGTGKTPVAEYLLHYFGKEKGLKAAYLSRGYGRRSKGYRKVPALIGTASDFGDEALQVAHKFPELPVAVCEDRREGIQRLVEEEGAQVIVLDDAFQHRRVIRDLDLVLLDAGRLPGQDVLLPAGNLREPREGLRRASFLIVNKVGDPSRIPEISRALERWDKPLAFSTPRFDQLLSFGGEVFPAVPPTAPAAAIAFAGLGNNDFFFRQLEANGITLLKSFSFPDHYVYQEQDLAKIERCYRNHKEKKPNFASLLLLTTEKDYFRLQGNPWLDRFRDLPLCFLSIRLKWWQGQELLLQRLEEIAHQAKQAAG